MIGLRAQLFDPPFLDMFFVIFLSVIILYHTFNAMYALIIICFGIVEVIKLNSIKLNKKKTMMASFPIKEKQKQVA